MAQDDRVKRAREVEAKHQEILDAWAAAQSVERIRELEGAVIRLRRDYTSLELSALAVEIPAKLDPTNREHAIVLAVRGDLIDTEQRMDAAIAQRRLGDASKRTVSFSMDVSGGAGGGVLVFLDKLGTVGKLALAGAVIYLLWPYLRRKS